MGKNYPAKSRNRRNTSVGASKLRYNPYTNNQQLEDPKEVLTTALYQLNDRTACDSFYNRLDSSQREYYHAILDNKVVVIDDEAGKGKTAVAFLAGIKLLREGKVDRLMYLRFPDDEGEKLGYTPGELEAKESKYMTPAYEALIKCGLQDEAIEILRRFGMIAMTTDATLRGCNLERTFLFMDETQNGTIRSIQKVMTRLHDGGGTVVMAGHSGQVDNLYIERYGQNNLIPFQVYQVHMLKQPFTVQCSLTTNYRGKISRWADRVYETVKELEHCGFPQ